MQPLFSIITVTYNAAATIGPTLESVRAQTSRLYEYIVIDGASKDDTVRRVKESGIEPLRIISEPDRGLYDAMNKGLAIARGEYVIFLNAGDRFHSPDTLKLLTDAVMDNDFPGVVYGQTDIVDSEGKRLADRHLTAPRDLTLKSFAEGMFVCHQAFVALRKLTSPFDTNYRFSADYDWCIKVLQRSRRNLYVDATLIDYLSEGVTTKNRRASLKERFKIMSNYYGFWPTVARHLSFIPRYLRRRRLEKQF